MDSNGKLASSGDRENAFYCGSVLPRDTLTDHVAPASRMGFSGLWVVTQAIETVRAGASIRAVARCIAVEAARELVAIAKVTHLNGFVSLSCQGRRPARGRMWREG